MFGWIRRLMARREAEPVHPVGLVQALQQIKEARPGQVVEVQHPSLLSHPALVQGLQERSRQPAETATDSTGSPKSTASRKTAAKSTSRRRRRK